MANAPKTAAAETETKVEETKAQKFERLAVVRMNKVLEFMEKLEGLSNKNIYEYTPEQVEKIVGALRNRTDKLERALNAGKVQQGGFSL
jgi:hypothetical protein